MSDENVGGELHPADEVPLTRRQLRERERAEQVALASPNAPSIAPPAVVPTALPTALQAPSILGSPTSMPMKSQVQQSSDSPTGRRSVPHRRRKAIAARALSCAAMLFAAAILVGVSVPSNIFVHSGEMAAGALLQSAAMNAAAASRTTQSLAVSDTVVSDVAQQDSLKVISYAEVLALQYAGISYEYRATDGDVRWPFPYAAPITDGFGDRVGGFHKGTDFAVRSGTPIYAIADGVVSYVQADYSGYGYNAIISHVVNGQQLESQYAHMITDSSPLVVGEPVRVGDFVGLVGETGISYGAHLHLEIHLDGVPADPYAWLTSNAVD